MATYGHIADIAMFHVFGRRLEVNEALGPKIENLEVWERGGAFALLGSE